MQTKLTLRLDDAIINKAKQFAKRTGKSLSQIVADFFEQIEKTKDINENEIPPITRSLHGILSETEVDEKDYFRYLEEKHL